MAANQPRKNLKIGIFRGKESLKEEVVKKHHSLTFGKSEKNTYFVGSSSMPDSIELFSYDQNAGAYTLKVPVGTRGSVRLSENNTLALDQIKASNDHALVSGKVVSIPLPETARGKIYFGKILILFQFIMVRADTKAMLIKENRRLRLTDVISPVLLYPLLFSVALHLGFLTYIMIQDWPRDDESIGNIVRFLREADLKSSIETEKDEPKPEDEVIEDPNAEPGEQMVEDIPDAGDSGASKEDLMERITDAHREAGAAITAQILGIDGGDAGDFFGAMLGSSVAIADMSDVSASDIGIAGTGGLLGQLAASSNGGSGNGLLTIGDGQGSGGPRVVTNGSDAKKNVERKKIEYKMTDSSEFTASAPPGSKEAIEAVFKKKKNDIANCYQRVTNAQGKATGRFVITISVDKNGTVIKVDKIQDQIGGDMFSCVRQRIMNWKFGPQKAPITFRKTWVFS